MNTYIYDATHIVRCQELLRDGNVIALPTETVYGLAANAYDADAVQSIYSIKNRSIDNPIIVHIASLEQLNLVVTSISDDELQLFEKLAPGPLTLIVEHPHEKLAPAVLGKQSHVAVRIIAHPLTRNIIESLSFPIAAPSANISGRPSPTNALMAYSELKGLVPAIVDGGMCDIGLESSIIKVNTEKKTISLLRHGSISIEAILTLLSHYTIEDMQGIIVPGTHYPHYQPQVPIQLYKSLYDIKHIITQDSGVIIYGDTEDIDITTAQYRVTTMHAYAQKWYYICTYLENKCTLIYAPDPQYCQYNPHEYTLMCALRDRMMRASGFSVHER